MKRILNKIGLTTWRRRLVALAILLPLVGGGSAELTSRSFFCNSCHIMGPYYDSWKHSAHKDVACVKCHISPGVENFIAAKFNGLGQVVDDLLHRTSNKPSASVDQLACMRSGCHSAESVASSSKTTGKYLFKHETHLGLEYSGIRIACSTCHSHVKGDTHFELNTNVCLTCHLIQKGEAGLGLGPDGAPPSLTRLAVRERRSGGPAGPWDAPPANPDGGALPHSVKMPPEACVSCHNPPEGTLERGGLRVNHSEYLAYGASCESCHRGTTAVPVPVENGQCYACHTFGLERNGNVEDMHRIHNEGRHKIECFSCHGTVHHGPTAQVARLEQFECANCHTDQHGVQRSTYLHTVDAPTIAGGPHAVSPMFLAHVDCTGCHIQKRPVSGNPESGATVAIAVPEACDACHKPGLGREMIPLWQRTTRSLYDQVEAGLAAAEAEVTSTEGRALLDEVRKLQQTVRTDGSWGVHNPRYTQQLLEEARAKLAAARAPAPTEDAP